MRRAAVISASLLVAVVLGLALAHAASLGAGTASLGAGAIATPRCTTSGLAVTQNLSGTSIASVTVTGVPSTCGAGTMYATVNNGSASSSGSSAIPAGGGTVTVTLAATVPATTVDEADILVTGP